MWAEFTACDAQWNKRRHAVTIITIINNNHNNHCKYRWNRNKTYARAIGSKMRNKFCRSRCWFAVCAQIIAIHVSGHMRPHTTYIVQCDDWINKIDVIIVCDWYDIELYTHVVVESGMNCSISCYRADRKATIIAHSRTMWSLSERWRLSIKTARATILVQYWPRAKQWRQNRGLEHNTGPQHQPTSISCWSITASPLTASYLFYIYCCCLFILFVCFSLSLCVSLCVCLYLSHSIV